MHEGLRATDNAIPARVAVFAMVVDVVVTAQASVDVKLTRLVGFDGGDVSEIDPVFFHDTAERIPSLEQLIPVEKVASRKSEQPINTRFHAQEADFSLRTLSGF